MNSRAELAITATTAGCRVCGSAAIASLPIAVYAPFFGLRVDTRRDRFALYTARYGVRAPRAPGLAAKLAHGVSRATDRILGKGEPEFLRTSCNFCTDCQSLTLSHAYDDADLEPLYVDYRSASYDADRISVEPGYRDIAHRVGQDPLERSTRNAGVARFLQPLLPAEAGGQALDLGGSDGKFIPHEVIARYRETHIVDSSDAAVDEALRAQGVRKVPLASDAGYELVMCMHVLEHVGSPRQFVLDSLRHLRPGGLLYLEVPLELDPQVPAQFQARLVDRIVTIHEHINHYHADSIPRLVESIDRLRLLKCESAEIDCGWTRGTVGRVLAQRVD